MLRITLVSILDLQRHILTRCRVNAQRVVSLSFIKKANFPGIH